MANQISVNSGTGNITVTTSRAVIGTVANVASANVANTVLNNAQPNITSVGTLTSLAISGDITTVDSMTLDVAATEAYATAKMWWDVADGTFNMGLYNNVTHHVGQQLYFYGKAVGNITKGQTVMFAGVQGDHILMSAADASSVGFKKEYLIGIATQNVSNGSFGYVTWFGKILDVDTRGYPAGSLLWFDPTTVGGLTNVEPTGNSIKVLMAAVIKAETSGAANNGVLLVRPTFEPALNDIQGVQLGTPLNGQVLTYNAANSTWINANIVANVSNVAFAETANTANYANFAGNATIANVAYSVSGANVTGTVANANYATNAGNANFANTATVASSANSVTLANVSGAGNIASINLDGSASNVLYGNGVFAAAATGNVANANYANFAGNAFSVDGGNVVGAVANATYAANAGYSTDGALANVANIAYFVDAGNVNGTVANAAYADNAGNANVAYSVDVANVANIGNIATINLDGNVSNLLTGNGTFVAIPTDVANANYANFAGTVLTNAQPNITSVGTLTALTANTITPISVIGGNGNAELGVINSSNAAGRRVVLSYNNPVTFQNAALNADENGFGYFIANTTPGNVFPGNIKSYWQFVNSGNLQHTIGGSGFVVAKGFVAGTGNVSAGNVNVTATITAPNITANTGIFTGNAAGLTNIPGANVTGTVANANIANIAYFVDGANVSGAVANATFALDAGNANYANFAGTVLTNAQPNITSVGTLIALDANTTTAINVVGGNGNVELRALNSSNTAGRQVVLSYLNPVTFQNAALNANENGFGYFIANTAPGNVFPGNIKSYWQFLNNGNLQHTIGGSGFVVAKGFVAGTGNVSAGNVVTSNIVASGTLNLSTNGVTSGAQLTGRSMQLNGLGEQPPSNNVSSLLTIRNGSLSLNQDNIGGGLATFDFKMYENTNSFLNPYTFFRARGNATAPSAVANGDIVTSQQYYCYADSGNTYVGLGRFDASVKTNDGAGNIVSTITLATQNNNDGSEITLSTDNINLNGNVNIGGGNFMQLSVYPISSLTAITGQLGQIATVSDSTPNGMMAYWDGTNTRWSYVHDNSAV